MSLGGQEMFGGSDEVAAAESKCQVCAHPAGCNKVLQVNHKYWSKCGYQQPV